MAEDAKKDAKKEAPPAPAAKGGGPLSFILPAVLAGAAAFGGAKIAGAGHGAEKHETPEMKPPGPTMALEPFILAIPDKSEKVHTMKVAIAIEFDAHEKEEALKALQPRVRDAVLTFLRSLTYEKAADREEMDKARAELLEAVKKVGATTAEQVLITEFILQ